MWGNCFAHITTAKIQMQSSFIKESCAAESKEKNSASHFKQLESSEKAWREKKKKWQKNRQEINIKKAKDIIPATGTNMINTSRKKKKKDQQNLSYITCYNCDKKGHYVNNCLKFLKNQCQS